MFWVKIDVDDFRAFGLTALDLRRKFKLSDGTEFRMDGHYSRRVEVSEGFARRNFGPNDVHVSATIPLEVLAAGDLMETPAGMIELADDMSDNRICELWVANHIKLPVITRSDR